jgi:indolepyruvate ferredoxin oxidoreductase alpha subunit
MKKLNEVLLDREPGSEIMMGNWALVRAMVENQVRVVTSYPGSPTPEIGAAILGLPVDQRPMYFEWSVNEKVATEVAFGASINGHLSCVFMKSVGLNVAADSFVQLGHMELVGGMVIVLGDDPGANSSQNEQDNRHLARLSYTPLLEPATPTEVMRMFGQACELSIQRRMPVIVRLTTHVCHHKELVHYNAWEPAPRDDTPRFDKTAGPYIPIARTVFPLKERALTKLEQVRAWADEGHGTTTVDHGNAERGVITMGLPFTTLTDVLEDAGAPPDVLKLDLVYPLPRDTVAAFCAAHDEVKVLEELDDFLEQEIKALAYERGLTTRIIGKQEQAEWMGEYTPDVVHRVLRATWEDLLPAPPAPPTVDEDLASRGRRPPQLCPGCGHRTVFHAVRRWLREQDIAVADIGCHTLGYLPPYGVGDALLCMGHSNGTAAGLGLFNDTRRVIAFIGDSTFFHAGLPGIINAVFNGHDHTLIVMENGTTAMTGHQDHAASGANAQGPAIKVPVQQVLEGLGVTSVTRVPAYQQDKLIAALDQSFDTPGFSVIIASHPCMLKQTRERRRAGKKSPPPVMVNDSCEQHYVCVSEFGCPSYQVADEEGASPWVQEDLCIGDRSCIQTCPAGAITPKPKEASNG